MQSLLWVPTVANIPMDELTGAMKLDKKTLNNTLKVVLLHEIGESYTYATDTEFFAEEAEV